MLEVIVQNPVEARQAEEYGADRIEVVSAISEGGLTPSYGTIKEIRKATNLPAMIMIRPHSYSFIYQKEDQMVIREDIEIAKSIGIKGIVFGALTSEGEIDRNLLENVLRWKENLALTFHRAIDSAADIEASYKILRHYGCEIDQILTSGGTKSALDSISRLKRWIHDSKQEPSSFKILVGSGINTDNIKKLHTVLENTDYHVGSGVRVEESYQNPLSQEKIIKFQARI